MTSKRFWKGFAAGAAAGTSAGFGSWLLSRTVFHRSDSSVVRLEKSVQIGAPIDVVFGAWSDLERLPSRLRAVEEVRVRGPRSHWKVRFNGKSFEWDAKITQNIRNQSLGWKSLSGPKHTGRVTFSPLGGDTEVHVVMNYVPPGGELAGDLVAQTATLEDYLAQALRGFKAALESKSEEREPASVPQRPAV